MNTTARKLIPNATELISTASTATVNSELAGLEQAADYEREERKLDILNERIKRIRAEKERLNRIQELETLEEQTKREILTRKRKLVVAAGVEVRNSI